MVFILPIHGQEKSSKNSNERQDAENVKKQSTPTAPGIVVNQQTTNQYEGRSNDHPDGYFRRLISPGNLPNVGLFFVGIGGIIAALLTLRAIRQELVLTQRPRIYVRNLYFSEITGTHPISSGMQVGSSLIGQFYIVNNGGTAAHIREFYCDTRVEHYLPMKRPYEGKDGVKQRETILPGRSTPRTFSRIQPLAESERVDIQQRRKDLYVLGWIEYVDDLKIRRRMSFCRKYDFGKQRFVRVKDPDYEHSD